jgi:diacylglycerol kinase (ATP)
VLQTRTVLNALLIINPTAGQARPQTTPAALQETLAPFVGKTLVTQGPGDAEAAAHEASTEGRFDAVLVAGGDGTINEVVNGLMAGHEQGHATLPLGLIPLGTQNVLSHELQIPAGDPSAFTDVLRGGKTRGIDLGRIEDRYFALMAGFGFDAAVVRDVLLPVKELIGPAAYALSTLRTLANYRSTSIRLRLDGEEVTTEAYLVVVANAASYAFRHVKMTPSLSVPRSIGSVLRPRSWLCWPVGICAIPASATTGRVGSNSRPIRRSRDRSTATRFGRRR